MWQYRFNKFVPRSMAAYYTGGTKYKGLKAYTYSADFGDMSEDADLRCFCNTPHTCLKKGVHDLTKCVGRTNRITEWKHLSVCPWRHAHLTLWHDKCHSVQNVSSCFRSAFQVTRAVCKVRELTLLLQVGTSWRRGDGLFFEVHPLVSDALLTTLHPLLENVLQPVDHFEISCLRAPISWLEKPRNRMGWDLDYMADVLIGFHLFRWAHPLPLFNRATLTLH
jgi:hypothetical protein